MKFNRQVAIPLVYKGAVLDTAYRLDILEENLVVVEIKSVERLERIHVAQLLSYLKLSDMWLGLLLNFNVPLMKNGIKRLVNG
ncbi:GxxExxY protein [Sedimenticola hydrogenitrophicus]|uniref:GxxExxY protein n=1 Tax=Sedimenticola hydrogenitrophicus TaxID=2967975 RepID=UPI002FFA32DD